MLGLTAKRCIATGAELLAALMVCLAAAALTAGCGASGGASPSPTASPMASASPSPTPSAGSTALPAGPAGRQLAWVLAGLNAGKPVSAAVLQEHFGSAFLAQVPPAQLLAALTQVAEGAPYKFGQTLGPSTPTGFAARIDGTLGSLRVTIAVDTTPQHHITGLLFQPYTTVTKPIDWSEADGALRSLASRSALLAAEIDATADTQRPIHELDADRALAIGSAFKLYVLGALGAAVQTGSAAWDEQLAIHEAWKSLPSGDMRNAPPGKRFPLEYYAQQMIAVSDNTATDHLMHRLGRVTVEGQLTAMGNSAARQNRPFLTTREMFALKLSAPQALRHAYTSAGSDGRRRLLRRIDALPVTLGRAATWTTPRDIDTIEWFASPRDLARAMTALRDLALQPGLAPIRAILSRNPGIAFDAGSWKYTAFKGGSEPGVLSLTWLLERADRRVFVLSIVLNDPQRGIDQAGAVAVAEGAVGLLAKAP